MIPELPAPDAPAADNTGLTLGVLIASDPSFRFCRVRIGQRGLRWIAERINGTSPGLHTMITADLSETARRTKRR